ncbi:MAG TPA: carbon-nitrogen hydrolase family protein [Nitratifractor sp.]|nr:carbon-nitrogen hydrolase family protein [Nitratifractor sp.]
MQPVTLLQLKTLPSYKKNLSKLIEALNKAPKSAIIVAPELYLTGFDYDNIEEACSFSEEAIATLQKLLTTQTLVLTLFRKVDNNIVNQAAVIHNRTVVHKQNKHKLFKLGNEHHHFNAGNGEDIALFEINGIKFGLLICFELRFKELWQKLEGADIICIPSQWGEPRKRHLEILGNALAVMNQCFVLVCNSADETMAKSSAIYSPMGGTTLNDASEKIEHSIDLQEIKLMRRYISLS